VLYDLGEFRSRAASTTFREKKGELIALAQECAETLAPTFMKFRKSLGRRGKGGDAGLYRRGKKEGGEKCMTFVQSRKLRGRADQ